MTLLRAELYASDGGIGIEAQLWLLNVNLNLGLRWAFEFFWHKCQPKSKIATGAQAALGPFAGIVWID